MSFYAKKLIKHIQQLPEFSFLFWDIDGVILDGETLIQDFDIVYQWIEDNRPDLWLIILSHRRHPGQCRFLEQYEFNSVFGIDDIIKESSNGDKTAFIRQICGLNTITHTLLIDDSSHGKKAEQLGYGYYIKKELKKCK